MKRRSLLVAAGALGVAPLGAAAEEDHDCEETTEIVTGRSGDEATSTEEVPAAWWEQVERTRDGQDELAEEFGDEEWFEGTGRSAGSHRICGRNAMTVTVYTSDVAAAESQVDEDREDVPVSIEERTGDSIEDIEDDIGDEEPDHDGNGSGDETESDPEDDESDPTPGFGVLGALSAIGTGGFLLGRRRSDDKRE